MWAVALVLFAIFVIVVKMMGKKQRTQESKN
jgi:hypothetical protein